MEANPVASQPHPSEPSNPDAEDASRTTTAGRTRLGRSGPRSRSGCATCKKRRVRCDEKHPRCGACQRLELDCVYKLPLQRWRQARSAADRQDDGQAPAATSGQPYLADPPAPFDSTHDTNVDFLSLSLARRTPRNPPNAHEFGSAGGQPAFNPYSRSGQATPNPNSAMFWDASRRFEFNDIFSDLNTSWAGEFSCMLPDVDSPPGNAFQHATSGGLSAGFSSAESSMPVNTNPSQPSSSPARGGTEAAAVPPRQAALRRYTNESLASSRVLELRDRRDSDGDNSAHLLQLFRKIVQPPAAILIGGFERWRRLQHYLCKLSDQSRAVRSSLLCLIELLVIDETEREQDQGREACMMRILERHAAARAEIEMKLSKHAELKPKTREHLLAAIFLLSWFEVIRDQDTQSMLFPRHLADAVITSDATWSRYSQQLLSWLNTLDSKATHLGGEHLLSPKSLEVVSHYPTQITSSLDHGENDNERDPDDSELSVSEQSPGESHHSPAEDSRSPLLRMGQVKQVMLNTILQPALEWYLTSQSYCRRISAHDKHHRKRSTSDDEYEVITACKQLESELFELWDYRPAIISVAAEQLMAVVSPDIATRLEEIFSVYLASFWILFVYLHRVSWWNFPHSTLTKRALVEVWHNMQRAYGEEVNGPLRKVIHPSLLWPLFLFGTECLDPSQQTWAIEQLEALGEAKPVLQNEMTDANTLPPFRLSSGATRNAKRAAVLLRELIKEQQAQQARVDDRELSMKLFGCYFSIV